MTYTIHHGDCLDVLRTMADESVDAIVTDPPYGLAFMGKRWDYDVPSVDVWAECLRVLKPGGHLLAFAGTRTQHRMAVRIEDAGFEIRDMIAWVYGSGFPKSLDVSKAIDKAAGAEREVVGKSARHVSGKPNQRTEGLAGSSTFAETIGMGAYITAPATDAARAWQGWGTAMKPALEPITVARKPLIGTVAQNVLAQGTGALNIDACRVPTDDVITATRNVALGSASSGVFGAADTPGVYEQKPGGRWPTNLIHDGSDEVLAGFPVSKAGIETKPRGKGGIWQPSTGAPVGPQYGDTGSAARFFYCAKASKRDRDEGLEKLPETSAGQRAGGRAEGSAGLVMAGGKANPYAGTSTPARNSHPTVKPTDLMRYLCRLVTPPGGVVLDPFMGSGSTGKAAVLEGFRFIGIEREAEYVEIARARIDAVAPSLFAAE